MPSPSTASLSQLILLRAVQRLEAQQGPLDDAQAMREAHAQQRAMPQRLLARSAWLAREQRLDVALAQWRGRLPWLALLAAMLIGLLSFSLLQAVVGGSRQINAVAALLAVLGPHLLSLALWLLMLVAGSEGGGLARWLAWAMARLPGGTPAQTLVLEAGLDVLGRKRGLSAWVLGAVNHAIWSLALLLTLAGLVFVFSFLAYRLTWETTILDARFFAGFARISGWLPGLLGFATPELGITGSSGADDNRGWALWLLGCTLVYGLGLRLIALLVSVWRSRRLLAGLTLDSEDPQLRQLMQRFAALDASALLDAEHHRAPPPPAPPEGGRVMQGAALLGYELPLSLPWPPAGLPAPPLALRIAGAADEKRRLLAQLQDLAPQRLLLVCHGPSSPDRGTERFVREALQRVGAGALLLSGEAGAARWHSWVADCALPLQAVFDAPAPARAWLEGADHGR
ncbi:DUF2868 domain-containing protein [Roseateles cavernae]|uniref:DUF2868 domain-containing protein n=1 Tax=Roseateles cavernae TaxID=3153578 RepID=UPI0032E3760B